MDEYSTAKPDDLLEEMEMTCVNCLPPSETLTALSLSSWNAMNIPGITSPMQLERNPVYRCTFAEKERDSGFIYGAGSDDMVGGFWR